MVQKPNPVSFLNALSCLSSRIVRIIHPMSSAYPRINHPIYPPTTAQRKSKSKQRALKQRPCRDVLEEEHLRESHQYQPNPPQQSHGP